MLTIVNTKMADMWFPGLKKEFIMHTPPAKLRIYVKSSALCTSNYGHIIKLNKQHNKTMIWLGIK